VFHGVSYLGERDVSVNTSVSESEATCVMQVDQACFKENRSEILSKYCRIYSAFGKSLCTYKKCWK
jgi:hypothetical protein